MTQLGKSPQQATQQICKFFTLLWWYSWCFHSSGMWCHVTVYMVPEVLRKHRVSKHRSSITQWCTTSQENRDLSRINNHTMMSIQKSRGKNTEGIPSTFFSVILSPMQVEGKYAINCYFHYAINSYFQLLFPLSMNAHQCILYVWHTSLCTQFLQYWPINYITFTLLILRCWN
jgi:hypothetical protein